MVKSQNPGLEALLALAAGSSREISRPGLLRKGEDFAKQHPQMGMLHLQAVSAAAGKLGMSVQLVNQVVDEVLPEWVKVVGMEAGKVMGDAGKVPGMNLDGRAAVLEPRD
jgi:hypothetical protein